MRKVIFFVLLVYLCAISNPVFAKKFIALESRQDRLRFSFDNIHITNQEKMGLLGLHYDWDSFLFEKTYLGFGVFGALTGDRGGFFVGGVTFGYKTELWKGLDLDLGIFAGGGGGASAFPGSGAMLRPHLVLGKKFDFGTISVGIANSNISGKDTGAIITGGLSFPLYLTIPKIINSEYENKKSEDLTTQAIRITPIYTLYFPDSNVLRRDSTDLMSETVPILGLQLDYFLSKALYLSFEPGGAWGGNSDGYGQIFGGVGYLLKINSLVDLDSKFILGMSGGGGIDTGGGLVVQPLLGINIKLFPSYVWKIMIGKNYTYNAGFQATVFKTGLSWTGDLLMTKDECLIDPKRVNLAVWDINIGNKIYFPKPGLKMKTGRIYEPQIHLFGVQVSTPINNSMNIFGAGYTAYAGEVGAYAEGWFGLKTGQNITKKSKVFAQLALGASGGGGINVGDGLAWEWNIGWESKLLNDLGLNLKYGQMQGLGDNPGLFHADVFIISVEYLIQTAFKK
ncbi:hypothetical protein ACFL2K_00435 [Candidatus Margulisiibacteriota bacterium]